MLEQPVCNQAPAGDPIQIVAGAGHPDVTPATPRAWLTRHMHLLPLLEFGYQRFYRCMDAWPAIGGPKMLSSRSLGRPKNDLPPWAAARVIEPVLAHLLYNAD